MPKYSDWNDLPARHVEEIAATRAITEAKAKLGLNATIPESAAIMAAVAEAVYDVGLAGGGGATVEYVDDGDAATLVSATALVDAEASARATAVTNEATARAAGDTTEANARVSGDATTLAAAAGDATTKMNSAVTTAAADATTKMNTAISTAATDATTKANAAQAAAATDATTKANAAQAAAIAEANTQDDTHSTADRAYADTVAAAAEAAANAYTDAQVAAHTWYDIRTYGAVDQKAAYLASPTAPAWDLQDTLDTQQAFVDAIAACPAGGTVFIPAGVWVTTLRITVEKSINIVGEGNASTIWVEISNAQHEGLKIGHPFDTAKAVINCRFKDFSVMGGAACIGVTFYQCHNCDVDITVRPGGTPTNITVAGDTHEYGGHCVAIGSCLGSRFRIVSSQNYGSEGVGYYGRGGWRGAAILIQDTRRHPDYHAWRLLNPGFNPIANNANIVDGIVEAGTVTGGLYIQAQPQNGGNNTYRGLYQGMQNSGGSATLGSGYGIYIEGGWGFTLENVHIEDCDVNLRIVDFAWASYWGETADAVNTGQSATDFLLKNVNSYVDPNQFVASAPGNVTNFIIMSSFFNQTTFTNVTLTTHYSVLRSKLTGGAATTTL